MRKLYARLRAALTSPSTHRALRTLYQGVLFLIVAAPLLVTVAPAGTTLASVAAATVGGIAVMAKLVNALEDAGLIPAWLKGATTAPEPPAVPEPEAPAEVEDPEPES